MIVALNVVLGLITPSVAASLAVPAWLGAR
jgi:hypothetical protein